MNAAAALYLSDAAKSYAKGVDLARQAIADGRAMARLEALREMQGYSE